MPLINEDAAIFLDPVTVGSICAAAHQNHTAIRAEMEIHTALEAGAPRLAHLKV